MLNSPMTLWEQLLCNMIGYEVVRVDCGEYQVMLKVTLAGLCC